MICVTPADLGQTVAAIVQRCGSPLGVVSVAGQSSLMYSDDDGHGVSVSFDADQMRARVLQFFTTPPKPALPFPDWNIMLPFASGAREIALGHMLLADAQSTLATDADVTTQYGAAYRSTARDDVVLAGSSGDGVLRAAFVGERAALVQHGIIAPELSAAPLDFRSPIPRDAWLRGSDAPPGSHATIVRVDVDASGVVRKVTVVVPSGDTAFDASLQTRIGDARFRPATLDEHPVPGTSFIQVRH